MGVYAMLTTNTIQSMRPKWAFTASGKLLDALNSAAPTLSTHREAIQGNLRHAEEAAQQLQPATSVTMGSSTNQASTPQSRNRSVTTEGSDPDKHQSDSESEQRQLGEFQVIMLHLLNSHTYHFSKKKVMHYSDWFRWKWDSCWEKSAFSE